MSLTPNLKSKNLSLNGKAKRKEHGAKSKDGDFLLHVVLSVSIHLSLDTRPPRFLAHLVSSVIYHADGNKEKCDLHGGRRQGFVK
jgi:hypothetical protein